MKTIMVISFVALVAAHLIQMYMMCRGGERGSDN